MSQVLIKNKGENSSQKNHKNTFRDQENYSRLLLEKMTNNWSKRAQVRKHEPVMDLLLDETKPDFLINLLPFKDHPRFLEAEEFWSKILSCGWLLYNQKTVEIESKVVNPVCQDIIYQVLPGVDNAVIQGIAADTQLDEAFHLQLVNKACWITREQRGLQSLKLPEFNLILKLNQEMDKYNLSWQKILTRLAMATVSEVFISDYLELLSSDKTIQPFNRVVVDTHRKDEQAHSYIFKNLAKSIYRQLSTEQKEFFISILPKAVYWFADLELGVWHAMLTQINLPAANEIIADCAAIHEVNLTRIDYKEVTALALELDPHLSLDIFGKQGLIN